MDPSRFLDPWMPRFLVPFPRDHMMPFPLRLVMIGWAVAATPVAAQSFEVYEATIPQLQSALTAGRVTSVQLVGAYLDRIARYDQAGPRINAIIRLNPQARADAAAMDAERRAGRVRGPLHGIPILLKDN